MTKKILASSLALLLMILACTVPVLADDPKPSGPANSSEAKPASEKATANPNTKLKRDMKSLVDAAKAGKVAPRPQQFPNTHRNNLSTGAKIGIVAGIGAAIFLIFMFRALNSDND